MSDRQAIQNGSEFLKALNEVASTRESYFEALGRYLRERPSLHETLAELIRRYPPDESTIGEGENVSLSPHIQ